ncbi:MAG: LysM peptidoglycan-binding domain-containing protein [Anaerolineales bacterium]
MTALAPVPAVTLAQEPLYHTVQPGENLYRIGLKYGVGWPEIVSLNGLPDTRIYVGQRLLIRGAAPIETVAVEAASAASEPPTAAAGTAPPASLQQPVAVPVTHTVQRGETLFNIAVRYGTSTAAIAQANGIANANFIFAGQQLKIPGSSPSRNTLTGATGQGLAAAPTAPPPASTPALQTSKRIVVDISDQQMWVYEGETLLWNWVISTGMAGADTRPGTYHVQSKFENAYGGNWNIWMPHWLGIYWAGSLENGIHALPILPNGSRLWAGVLGAPVSYGCVVLGTTEAETLYNWAEIGTEVVIEE